MGIPSLNQSYMSFENELAVEKLLEKCVLVKPYLTWQNNLSAHASDRAVDLRELFLFFSPAPQIIEVLFHELLAFGLFLLVSLSLRISLLKISQESHLRPTLAGCVINLSIILL